jgi:hypothetical protein
MLVSIPANPIPSDLYHLYTGSSPKWLPWYIWGGGVYATTYSYNPANFFGYSGTVSLPFEDTVRVKSLRATGYCGAGSTVTVRLYQRTGNVSSAIASIVVNVAGSFDVTQSVASGGFLASAPDNSLAIEMIEQGQGICTVTGLIVDLS